MSERDDLPTRLRQWADAHAQLERRGFMQAAPSGWLREAADEIERLRAALAGFNPRMKTCAHCHGRYEVPHHARIDTARTADLSPHADYTVAVDGRVVHHCQRGVEIRAALDEKEN